jgi:hypothetical protein
MDKEITSLFANNGPNLFAVKKFFAETDYTHSMEDDFC